MLAMVRRTVGYECVGCGDLVRRVFVFEPDSGRVVEYVRAGSSNWLVSVCEGSGVDCWRSMCMCGQRRKQKATDDMT
jgi:hypothetical protein